MTDLTNGATAPISASAAPSAESATDTTAVTMTMTQEQLDAIVQAAVATAVAQAMPVSVPAPTEYTPIVVEDVQLTQGGVWRRAWNAAGALADSVAYNAEAVAQLSRGNVHLAKGYTALTKSAEGAALRMERRHSEEAQRADLEWFNELQNRNK